MYVNVKYPNIYTKNKTFIIYFLYIYIYIYIYMSIYICICLYVHTAIHQLRAGAYLKNLIFGHSVSNFIRKKRKV